MTLKDLMDQLDWSDVDKEIEAWNEKHPDAIRFSQEHLDEYRSSLVYNGLQALEEKMEIQCWGIIPVSIRQQIHDLYEKEGLIEKIND